MMTTINIENLQVGMATSYGIVGEVVEVVENAEVVINFVNDLEDYNPDDFENLNQYEFAYGDLIEIFPQV